MFGSGSAPGGVHHQLDFSNTIHRVKRPASMIGMDFFSNVWERLGPRWSIGLVGSETSWPVNLSEDAEGDKYIL